jgi:hypothetical protein
LFFSFLSYLLLSSLFYRFAASVAGNILVTVSNLYSVPYIAEPGFDISWQLIDLPPADLLRLRLRKSKRRGFLFLWRKRRNKNKNLFHPVE